MSTIEQSIEVEVPLSTAYNQWTQFEEFPQFMEGVERVQQIDDTHLHWVAEIAGQSREWDATITEQKPDERVAWAASGEVGHGGAVTFHRIDDQRTKVMVQLDWKPTSFAEKAGDMLGIVDSRLKGDLKRFKDFIETRGRETGAWRGEVDRP
ncbi:MAG TPA: SRPBCC family protein [Actinomycetota bacterium]|jgi:uncharacterized membrane protein|nr:SRPBCC family protein [Actinomycetota bacterium]